MRPYLRAANVGWQGLRLDDVMSMHFDDAEMETYRLLPGDLLLSEASGSATEVGKPALWSGEIEDCAFQNTLLRVRPGPSSDSRYLLHFFMDQAATGAFARRSRGVGIYHLGREALASLEVPLPPLDEQRRIAEILDQADALLAKRRQSLALLDQLTQSVFVEMFGDPVRNDRRWETVLVSDFVARFEGGKNLEPADESSAGRFRVLKTSAVTQGVFRAEESKPLPPEYEPPRHHLVRDGDVLFGRANTAQLIGATAIVEDPPAGLVLPDKVWRFVWGGMPVEPKWVAHLFRQPAFRAELSKRATGTSDSMRNISQAKVLGIACGLPPREIQRSFVHRLSRIQAQVSPAAVSDATMRHLAQALRGRAFAGLL